MMDKKELLEMLQRLPDDLQVAPLEIVISDLTPWGFEPCNLSDYRGVAERKTRLQQAIVIRVVCEVEPPEAIANVEKFKREM